VLSGDSELVVAPDSLADLLVLVSGVRLAAERALGT
jgi:hypothetical protein